jgi:phosphoglycolate phosphatase-like HAD superfamily hydrolase
MMDRQGEFQELAYPPLGMDRVEVTKDLLLGLHSEMDELLREIAWKAKRRQNVKVIPSNVREEIIDMLKLVMGIAVTWGFSAEEMYDAFMDKSDVVEQRWMQEFPLYEIIKQGAPVVVLDIDGVLADYPYCFYDFVVENFPGELKYARNFDGSPKDEDTQNPFEALENDPLTIRQWKDAYRQTGAKRRVDCINGAVEFTWALRARGYKIVLVTARPYHEYSRIFSDTMHWLKINDFAFDAIMWSERKEERLAEEFNLEQVALFVDDNPQNVERVEACGVTSALLKRPYNQDGMTFTEILDMLEA